MSEFLAPLDYRRARDTLRSLDFYTAYTPEGAERVRGLFESADRQLTGRQWMAGFRSFADPYLYVTLRWAGRCGIDLSDLQALAAFQARMEADPGVRHVLKAEGLA